MTESTFTDDLDAAIAFLNDRLDESTARLDANLREGQSVAELDKATLRIAALEELVKEQAQEIRQVRGEAFVALSRVAELELALDVARRPSPGAMPAARPVPTIAQKDLRKSQSIPRGIIDLG